MNEIAYWFWWNCYGKWKIRRECRRMTQAQRRDAAVANFKMFLQENADAPVGRDLQEAMNVMKQIEDMKP